jgi:hypothetical protein
MLIEIETTTNSTARNATIQGNTFSNGHIGKPPQAAWLNDLDTVQLNKLASTMPKWVFMYRPYFMMHYYPEWVSSFSPSWMAENDTQYMLLHRLEWMVHNKPDIVARFELDILIEKNPFWCVKNIPEILAYKAPQLLQQYDLSVYRAFCPEEHAELKGWKARIGAYLRKYRKYVWFGSKKSHAMLDPALPKEVLEVLYDAKS